MPKSPLAAKLDAPWLGLVVGNTRLHWGLFHQQRLQGVWHTNHVTAAQATALMPQNFDTSAWRSLMDDQPGASEMSAAFGEIAAASAPLPLYCASVVPTQTALWRTYSDLREVTLSEVPLANLYPTLGIDRALNLLGAGDFIGWPVLVIDAGTALTFTAGSTGRFIGGAILPGLTTQFSTLAHQTATLPATYPEDTLPPRWAVNTADALRSGIVYGTLATITEYVQAWRQEYKNGKVVLTGGDGAQLCQWSQQRQLLADITLEPDLTFLGLGCWRRYRLTTDCSF
ncbi:MAG: pantothenate kinase [Leptolyngbya sp. SIOISBB]|nr:pantothenate kinase [Leptolyngbya sp. SIOISBB]